MRRLISTLFELYSRFFFKAGRNAYVSIKSDIVGKKFIEIGNDVRILKYARLDTSANPSAPAYRRVSRKGRIRIGDSTKIKEYSMLITYDGHIYIGRNCTVNPFTIIYGQGGVTVGNNVMIASHCVLVSSNHKFDLIDESIRSQGIVMEGIVIEDDVWIGTGVKILDGVTIGKGSVVGSGSVVTKSLGKYGIYGGVPAKLLRKRE